MQDALLRKLKLLHAWLQQLLTFLVIAISVYQSLVKLHLILKESLGLARHRTACLMSLVGVSSSSAVAEQYPVSLVALNSFSPTSKVVSFSAFLFAKMEFW